MLAAVEYVTGTNPLKSTHEAKGLARERTSARRLACLCLAEICDLHQSGIARVLHLDHTTVRYHLLREQDYDAARLVAQRVSDKLTEEDLAEAEERERRTLARLQWGG